MRVCCAHWNAQIQEFHENFELKRKRRWWTSKNITRHRSISAWNKSIFMKLYSIFFPRSIFDARMRTKLVRDSTHYGVPMRRDVTHAHMQLAENWKFYLFRVQAIHGACGPCIPSTKFIIQNPIRRDKSTATEKNGKWENERFPFQIEINLLLKIKRTCDVQMTLSEKQFAASIRTIIIILLNNHNCINCALPSCSHRSTACCTLNHGFIPFPRFSVYSAVAGEIIACFTYYFWVERK